MGHWAYHRGVMKERSSSFTFNKEIEYKETNRNTFNNKCQFLIVFLKINLKKCSA